MEEQLYQYFLDKETKKWERHLNWFENGEYELIKGDKVHANYLDSKEKFHVLESTEIEEVLVEINNVKKTLPRNISKVTFTTIDESEADYFNEDDIKIILYWYEYSMKDKIKCEKIARSITNRYVWKIKHQPNGKDAKRAIDILNKIKNQQ